MAAPGEKAGKLRNFTLDLPVPRLWFAAAAALKATKATDGCSETVSFVAFGAIRRMTPGRMAAPWERGRDRREETRTNGMERG